MRSMLSTGEQQGTESQLWDGHTPFTVEQLCARAPRDSSPWQRDYMSHRLGWGYDLYLSMTQNLSTQCSFPAQILALP